MDEREQIVAWPPIECINCGDDLCVDKATGFCEMYFEHIMGEEAHD